ncbi:MAG: hypothetical protein IJZ27_01910 [Treponema sp.]|nr:hypothetical protein [Treponema sp.]
MESIENKIAELVEYVNTTYQKNKMFFADFQKSEESKIQAEELVQKITEEKNAIIVKVNSNKEIDEIVYYVVSILLGEDLEALLNLVYSEKKLGLVIFSRFQDVVARIFDMRVLFIL